MKNVILLVVLFASFIGFAHADELIEKTSSQKCLSTLTDDFARDSYSYKLNLDKLPEQDFGKDYLAKAIFEIRFLLKEEGCSKSAVNFGQGPLGRSKSRCKMVVPGVSSSLACYVETNLGYFMVNYDQLSTANIFYSRWD